MGAIQLFEWVHDKNYNKSWNKLTSFLTFQGTLQSTGEKVAMKLEDPVSKICYLPHERRVYEDLQKSKTRSFFHTHSVNLNLFFYLGAKNLLVKGFANMLDFGLYGKSEKQWALVMTRLGLDLVDNATKYGTDFYDWDDLRFIAKSAVNKHQLLRLNQGNDIYFLLTFALLDR